MMDCNLTIYKEKLITWFIQVELDKPCNQFFFIYSVLLTNKIQIPSSRPIVIMDDIKTVRRCKDLLITARSFKNKGTFLTNYIQEKNHTYQHVQRFSSIPASFPGLYTSMP